MMKSLPRGTLTLVLVSCIAMMMLLGFGFRATQLAQECEVAPVQCRYTRLIIAAKAPAEP